MEYLPVLIMMAAGFTIGGAVILISHLLGPKIPNRMKDSAAECGVPEVDSGSNKRMSVRFYLVAILFLLFDVEAIFFYPWAVVYKQFISQGGYIIVQMLAFVLVTLVGYIYILRRGALDWE